MTIGKRLTTKEFIIRANEIHKCYYRYPSDLVYKNYYTKVPIICPIHGEFMQNPSEHLKGKGCKLCGIEKSKTKSRKSFEWFKMQGDLVHEGIYSYHKDLYTDVKTKTRITCPIHGDFWQTPDKHIHGKEGCPRCSHTWIPSNDELLKKCKSVHGWKYDYSIFEYKDCKTKGIIICNKHGAFLQDMNHHLQGNGCPYCKSSKLEEEVELSLINNGINYDRWKHFGWLRNKNELSLDFYIEELNIAIECQGEQHYRPIKWFGGEINFNAQIKNDLLKKKLCEEHGIKLVYYSKSTLSDEGTFKEVDKLIEFIKCQQR